MTIRLKTLFFIFLGLFVLWFLYIEREILTPFILAAIFAYIFNPLVNFMSKKIKLPRTLCVVIIYLLLISLIITLGIFIARQVFQESLDLTSYVSQLETTTRQGVNALPEFFQPAIRDTLVALQTSKIFSPQYLFTLFPEAISRVLSFFIFLFAGFYLLREGGRTIERIIQYAPHRYKFDVEVLIRKIDMVCKGYLRGQLFLIGFVSLLLYVGLSILGVKFALILAIFSGFAEVVPLFGPIIAAFTSSVVAAVGGTTNFSLTPLEAVIVVSIMYFVVRQFQDYFVTPHVMGRITDLPPLVILFAVIAGGHLGGMLGYILAVPIAATVKLCLEFSMDQLHAWGQSQDKEFEKQPQRSVRPQKKGDY